MRRFKSTLSRPNSSMRAFDAAELPLQPVDLLLEGCALAVIPEQAQRPDALDRARLDGPNPRQCLSPGATPPQLDAPGAPTVHDPACDPCRLRANLEDMPSGQPDPDRRHRARRAPSARRPVVHEGPNQAFFDILRGASGGSSRSVTTVFRATAALRISERTTSSVIRALWASRSANWSRAAASGMRAATPSIS